jgi:hypothetical protein
MPKGLDLTRACEMEEGAEDLVGGRKAIASWEVRVVCGFRSYAEYYE